MNASGIAIAMATIAMFINGVYFRIALNEIPRASATTRKNQSLMTIRHLYFIRMKISANARANAKMIDRKSGVGSSCGAWSPNGSDPSVINNSCSPVSGLMIVSDCGA